MSRARWVIWFVFSAAIIITTFVFPLSTVLRVIFIAIFVFSAVAMRYAAPRAKFFEEQYRNRKP